MSRRRLVINAVRAPIIATPPGVFNFLQLPSELRNLIYEHVFTVPLNSITLPSATTKEGMVDIVHDASIREPPPPSVLSLLQPCRQVYDEASGIFYHINHISMYSSRLLAFSTTANLRPLRSVRTLTVVVRLGEDITVTLRKLRRTAALRVLKFDLEPYGGKFADRSLQTIAQERYFVRKALLCLPQIEEISLSPYDPNDWDARQTAAVGEHETFLKQCFVEWASRSERS